MENIDYASSYLELGLKVCGREICIRDKAVVLSTKPYHLLHYVMKGSGTLQINEKVYKITQGMMFYIPPYSQTKYSPDRENPWTYEWIGFDGAMVKQFLAKCGLSISSPIIDDKKAPKYKHYFDKIFNEYAEVGHINIICLGLAYQFFGELMKENSDDMKPVSSKEMLIFLAKDYILNNYQFDIKVDDIANNVGVTPNYLANVFASAGQDSPKRFLIKTRMEKAVLLLKSGNYKIKEISALVGYKNQLHFSSEFKKYIGISPTQYIK